MNASGAFREVAFPQSVRTGYPPALPGIGFSAVLALLAGRSGGWNLLYTRRSDRLADHSGQIAFPGGRAEQGDSGPLQTALREAHEEVGIPAAHVDALGILDPVDTSTGFRIWPVVGVLTGPTRPEPASPEVSEAFWIPLAWLSRKGRWEWRPAADASGRGKGRAVFFEPYRGRTLWGATALITVRLLRILAEGREA
jgi:8-oxo-dGTP pyrophosphatase MutT (NUDIX family)